MVGVFFFFKQKTAYEIGTGDWSSDVCSSDLPQRKMVSKKKRGRCRNENRGSIKSGALPQREMGSIKSWGAAATKTGQIGRASCRERV